MDEISNVTGGLRLLQALAAAEAASGEAITGPEAKVDLDVLWIFIGKVGPIIWYAFLQPPCYRPSMQAQPYLLME